jgi:hypothetical protein
MNTTPRTETTALIAAMEHWAKTISKNGGIAAVTIQEGADRLRELEAELAPLRELVGVDSCAASTQINNPALESAKEFRATVIGLSDSSTEKLTTIIRQHYDPIVQDLREQVNRAVQNHAAQCNRADKSEAECLEQARLLGMSASREASLLGKISQLEQQLEKSNS